MSTVLGTHVLPTYPRLDVTFERGEGVWLFGDDGKRYLDFLAGIAVCNLGHCHPDVVAAAQAQSERLWHVSNLFWTRPMAELDLDGGNERYLTPNQLPGTHVEVRPLP